MKRETLTEAQAVFLTALVGAGGPVAPQRLSVRASHEQDGPRQKCRRKGLAARVTGPTGRKQWLITPAGRQALAEREGKEHGRD